MEAVDLQKDRDKAAIVERNLQLAIECCVDIAELLIISGRLKKADDGKDAIIIVGEAGIIDKEFAREFSKTVGFRNLLIHEYLDIDYQKVAENLKSNLEDFEVFAQSVARYLTG